MAADPSLTSKVRHFRIPAREKFMPIVKGALLVFGFFLLTLIAFTAYFASRGGVMVTMSFVTECGMFMLGIGFGASVIGCGLLVLARMAMAYIKRAVG
jgi:hypothetical protein